MGHLTYLIDEVCAGAEIYFTGRQGGQYLKTAFILCDDYTELTSKLFLLADDPTWSDAKANGKFKNYHNVQTDVQAVFRAKRPTDLPRIERLLANMKARRDRRNDFFHSTKLLDLNVSQRNCVEAFCDLLDYGLLLFGNEWTEEVQAARNLAVLEILFRLEKKSFSDPSVTPRVNAVLRDCPRNKQSSSKKGVHVTEHPEDLHLRLSIIHGGQELRDKLSALL
jgi:hypothetical protein